MARIKAQMVAQGRDMVTMVMVLTVDKVQVKMAMRAMVWAMAQVVTAMVVVDMTTAVMAMTKVATARVSD